MRFLQHIVEPNKDKEKKTVEDNTDCSIDQSIVSKSDNSLVSADSKTMNLDVDSLPIPSMKKSTPKQSNMVDVNLNTPNQVINKPCNKLPMSDKTFDAILDHQGASSMEMLAHADGPAASNGNLCAASSAARSFDRIKSMVEEYGAEAPYVTQFSQDERDIAQALLASPHYTYKELCVATNGFSATCKLGQGKFGAVYYGLVKNTRCAIKKLLQRQERAFDEASALHMSSELKTLSRYRHENIVSMYGYALDNDEVCLVYQFMPNGSLYDCLFKRTDVVLTWEQRISILRGSACGLQFLHCVDKTPVIHGDIKSANVLLDRHFEAKIGDLGLAKSATGGEVTGRMTHITKKTTGIQDYRNQAYHPPEIGRGNGFSVKGDAYSFGVVIYECITGQEAYDELRHSSQELKYLVAYIENIIDDSPKIDKQENFEDKKMKIKFPALLYNLLFELACRCTSDKKKDRPSMVEVYKELEKTETEFQDPSYYNIPDLGKQQKQHSFESKLEENSVHEHRISTSGQACSGPGLKSPTSAHSSKSTSSNSFPSNSGMQNSCPSKQVPQSPLEMLPKGLPIPEAYKLQLDSDKRQKETKEGNYINVETISSKIKNAYVSDPKKLLEMENFDKALDAPHVPLNKSPVPQFRHGEPHENTEKVSLCDDKSGTVQCDNDFEYALAKDISKPGEPQEHCGDLNDRKIEAEENSLTDFSACGPKFENPKSHMNDEFVGFDEDFEKELDEIAKKAKGGGLMMGIFDKFEKQKLEENFDYGKGYEVDEEEFDVQFDFETEDSETSTITESVNNDYESLPSGDIDDNELFESGDRAYVNVTRVPKEEKEDNLDEYQKKLKMYQGIAATGMEDSEELTERSAQSEDKSSRVDCDAGSQEQNQVNSIKEVNIQEFLVRREPTEIDCEEYV
ncbi:hypothetical protein ACF0H5_013956 [Mactra antiquata]